MTSQIQMQKYVEWIEKKGLDYKQYQYDGVKWCVDSERRDKHDGPQGGFLADEMGLGKTITIIGTMIVNFLPKTLIVLPAVLVEQWVTQLYKTSGHRALVWSKGKVTMETLNKAIIVITTYGKLGGTTKQKKQKQKQKQTQTKIAKSNNKIPN